jgi:pimeloyl-ACP methyl ester carboxylesterase
MPRGNAARWRARRVRRVAASGAAVTAILAGCGSAPVARSGLARVTTSTARPAPTSTTTTEPPLPVSPIHWVACGSLQCGSVTVPLDYAHPGGATLQIAVARHPAEVPSQRIGSLVVNPGGPGTSGIDDLPNELGALDQDVLDRFDVVSFDPRGVERSAPVTCAAPGAGASPSGPPQARTDPVPTTAAARLALLVNDRNFAADCERYSGSMLAHVGTVDVARDLDRIRAALGDPTLTFIGHSYGTLLGATYATMFPTHVRAMVLDGAIDPALDTSAYVTGQAESFEAQLQDFFSWCSLSPDCAWHTGADPTGTLLALVQASRDHPLPVAGGGTAGLGEIYDALLAGLGSQSSWPALGDALARAAVDDGTQVSAMTTRYETGGSTNGADAEQAVDCLDHPVDRDPAAYPALAAQVGRSAPVFGPLLAWGLLGCATWPVLPTRTPGPASDPGAPPILVVGTTGDPVTPYAWAVGLAKELTGGVLLTWVGHSHVASFYSPCVRLASQNYLVDGILPAAGTTCTD